MKLPWTLLGALSTSAALAQTPPGCELVRTHAKATAGSETISALLSGADQDALERHLQQRLQAIAGGQDTDLMLFRDLDMAFTSGPHLRDPVERWVQSRPTSFFAHLAAAVHHRIEGHRARGGGFAGQTSKAQFEAMRREFDKAWPHARKAATINPRSALPQIAMMSMTATEGGHAKTAEVLDNALKADPSSIGARAIALNYLKPRWGGDFAQVKNLVKDARLAGLPSGHLHYLAFSVSMEQASHWWAVDKKPDLAFKAYEEALSQCPNSDRALQGFLANAYLLKAWDAIIREADRAEQSGMASAMVYRRRAQAHEARQDLALAIPDLERAASLGDGWSAGQLGHLHAKGEHVAKDWVKARRLLTAASDQGLAFARRELEWLDQQESQQRTTGQDRPETAIQSK